MSKLPKLLILTAVIFFILGAVATYFINKPQLNPSINTKPATISNKYFPIQKGNYWVYEGTKKEDVGDGKIETSNVQKRVEVLDVKNTADGKLVTLGGSAPDQYLIKDNTIDFDPGKPPETKLILKFPLSVGQKWGDKVYLKRDDGFYLHQVEEKLSKEILGNRYDDCFRITYKTIADSEYKVFCYGLGVVEEGYKHNGTILEWNYKLISSNKI